MVLSSYNEDLYNENIINKEKINKEREFQETKLPMADEIDRKIDTERRGDINPFLDKSLRNIIDSFVLTWHKILLDLLDFEKYKDISNKNEIWTNIFIIYNILKNTLWKEDRIFYIGVGFIIISFFVYFILVTE